MYSVIFWLWTTDLPFLATDVSILVWSVARMYSVIFWLRTTDLLFLATDLSLKAQLHEHDREHRVGEDHHENRLHHGDCR
jgi:hypothetical protein